MIQQVGSPRISASLISSTHPRLTAILIIETGRAARVLLDASHHHHLDVVVEVEEAAAEDERQANHLRTLPHHRHLRRPGETEIVPALQWPVAPDPQQLAALPAPRFADQRPHPLAVRPAVVGHPLRSEVVVVVVIVDAPPPTPLDHALPPLADDTPVALDRPAHALDLLGRREGQQEVVVAHPRDTFAAADDRPFEVVADGGPTRDHHLMAGVARFDLEAAVVAWLPLPHEDSADLAEEAVVVTVSVIAALPRLLDSEADQTEEAHRRRRHEEEAVAAVAVGPDHRR